MRFHMQACWRLGHPTVKSILDAISAPVGYCSSSTFGLLKGWMPCNSVKCLCGNCPSAFVKPRPIPPSEKLQTIRNYLHCGMELFELHASFLRRARPHFIGSLLNLRCAQLTSAGGLAINQRRNERPSTLRTAPDTLHRNTQARLARAVLGSKRAPPARAAQLYISTVMAGGFDPWSRLEALAPVEIVCCKGTL